ncbi:MAG: energy transducer TonB [Deltaproteobacteria bacterium]|nr:energy transducer TonB [Deltaproteobacteria bacterium]
MMAKKFLILFVLASLAGHALVIALTARIDMKGVPRLEKVMKVELSTTAEAEPPPVPGHIRPAAPAAPTGKMTPSVRDDSVSLQNPGGPYEPYLLQIRRKIEGLWSYPPLALSQNQQGEAVIRFTIDAGGALNGYYITSTSGSPILDEGALAVVRSAAPFAPLPEKFHLSQLHITATFRYRIN